MSSAVVSQLPAIHSPCQSKGTGNAGLPDFSHTWTLQLSLKTLFFICSRLCKRWEHGHLNHGIKRRCSLYSLSEAHTIADRACCCCTDHYLMCNLRIPSRNFLRCRILEYHTSSPLKHFRFLEPGGLWGLIHCRAMRGNISWVFLWSHIVPFLRVSDSTNCCYSVEDIHSHTFSSILYIRQTSWEFDQ